MTVKPPQFVELPGLQVTVDRVVHQPDAKTSPDRPHCFAYYITLHNHSDRPVTIKGRKWVVTEEDGQVTAVEGAGVVGQFPALAPGETFSYHSCHVLGSRAAVAEGSYLGLDDDGQAVLLRIPRFEMRMPESGEG